MTGATLPQDCAGFLLPEYKFSPPQLFGLDGRLRDRGAEGGYLEGSIFEKLNSMAV